MSKTSANPHSDAETTPGLRSIVARFETPTIRASVFQLATSIGLFALGTAAMYWSLHISYLLTLALAVPTAGFVVRIFIIQHDCGHGSFFKSRRANEWAGLLCSIVTFTPFTNWRRHHAGHHGNWNNLDRRESGADIYSDCMTLEEYRALTPRSRFVYRFVRHPVVAQLIVPPLVFMVLYRVPFDTPKGWARERRSVHITNLAMCVTLGGLALAFGLGHVMMVQLPVIGLAAIVGVFLFSVQHRFDGVVWTRQKEWDVTTASINGSSYFKLPRILQWFTGNIGFHHIHHLSPRVPNYRLEACHAAIPALQAVTILTWRDGFKAIRHLLWDETNHRMVRFSDARGFARPVGEA